ncbi:MAG: hypothetical protein GXZ11_03100 [Tissierellia bacterium]|nr:hypothetical protein [Tissierellia bacterium]
MISIKEMRKLKGKNIRLVAKNNKVFEGICKAYHQAEDEDEEPMLEIGKHWAIKQSEIKAIEILD